MSSSTSLNGQNQAKQPIRLNLSKNQSNSRNFREISINSNLKSSENLQETVEKSYRPRTTSLEQVLSGWQPIPLDFLRQRRWNNLSLDKSFKNVPHKASISNLDLEQQEARYLLSSSIDSILTLWDLQSTEDPTVLSNLQKPHDGAITSCKWFPLDTGMFITSSTDSTVKVWDTNTMEEAISWNLDASVVGISLSPICQSNQLIATATNQPILRLCDLRTSSATHTLVGHTESLTCVAWSPVQEHLLASAGLDKQIRLWDVRKANSFLGTLDMTTTTSIPISPQPSLAHDGPINHLSFTKQGYLISTGVDEKLRVWDMTRHPFNTMINYGPHLHNRYGYMPMQLALVEDVSIPLVMYPNDSGDILVFELWTGRLKQRLRGHLGRCNALAVAQFPGNGMQAGHLYSCGADGEILHWTTTVPVEEEDEWSDDGNDEVLSRLLAEARRPRSESPDPRPPRRRRRFNA